MAYRIPEAEFDPAQVTAPLDVLELSDIRREYTLTLARLELSTEFSELERTSTCFRTAPPRCGDLTEPDERQISTSSRIQSSRSFHSSVDLTELLLPARPLLRICNRSLKR